jgi:two-component system CheB/CheR fusion protein
MRRKDGHYYWMFLSANPNFSTLQEFTGFIGSMTNIEHQKAFAGQLEHSVQERTQALTEVNKKLEQSNEELRQFAYVASHDLQEPLRKIMTFADRTLEHLQLHQHDQVPAYLTKIIESSRRMSALINDLLNFSRSTRIDHEFVMTDLNTVLFDVVHDFDLSNHGKLINLDISRLPVLPAIPVQIRQLFHNLISNAVKFSSNHPEPKVTVSSRNLKSDEVPVTLDRSRKYAEIKVSDNGIGFDRQFADQIFIIFQRLHDKQTFPGTGIGLALCKKIVANHYGMIYADSMPNEGASFYLILPLNQP